MPRSLRFIAALLLGLLAPSRSAAEDRYFVLQLGDRSVGQVRSELGAEGFRELKALPGRRLLVERMQSTTGRTALALTPFARAARVSWELLQLTAAERDVPVLIHVMPGVSAQRAQRWLTDAGLPILGSAASPNGARISTLLPAARVASLATQLGAQDEVFFVERVHHLGLFNDRSAGSVQSGTQGAAAGMTPIWAKGIHGEGQILGIIDTGVDADSCWFSAQSDPPPKTNTWSAAEGYGQEVDASHSKVIAYDYLYSCEQFSSASDCDDASKTNAYDSAGHGSHCAGSMVGNRPGGQNNGMAPMAKLVVQDAGYKTNACADLPGLSCPIVDMYPLFAQAYAQGVRIHNNSYGDNEDAPAPQPSNYSARAQDVDRFVWDHKDMLLVFAAGNSGANDADFSVCSPSTSKNGLSVGSARAATTSDNDEDISSFSSRGWTADGRIKPELMAPGCTTSAGNDRANNTHNCSEASGCGTSYAAPILAGAAALVRQYFTDGFYPSGAKNPADALQPTAALLKAMLVNGAVNMTGRDNARQAITPIPSNEQGWGRIRLDRALIFQGAARTLYVDDHKAGFAAGDPTAVVYRFTGVDPSEPFKVTLAWTDFPGQPDGAPKAPKLEDPTSFNAAQLVNDLDLSASDGTLSYLGNVFKDGASVSGGSADRRNNIEQLLIARPTAGAWTLRVSPTNVVHTGQDFALVATGKWASAGPDREHNPPPSAAGSGGSSVGGAAAGAAAAIATAGHTPATSVQAGAQAQLGAAGGSGLEAPTTSPNVVQTDHKRSGCSIARMPTSQPTAAWWWSCTALTLAARRVERRKRQAL